VTSVRSSSLSRPGSSAQLALMTLGATVASAALVLGLYFIGLVAVPALAFGSAIVVIAFLWPATAITIATLLIPLELFALPLPSGSLSPAEGAFLVIGVASLFRLLLRPETMARAKLRDASIFVLLAAYLSGVVIAQHPAPSVRVFVLWSAFYLVYLQVQTFSTEQLRRILIAFACAAGLLGAIGSYGYLTSGTAALSQGGFLANTRASGGLEDANYYASMLVLAIMPALALVIVQPRRHALLLAPLAAALAGVIFSLSRGGISGLAVAVLTLLLWNRWRYIVLGLILALTALTIINMNPILKSRQYATVAERLKTINTASEVDRRPQIWATAIDTVQQHPFLGIGFNEFSRTAAAHGLFEYGAPLSNAHNMPLGFAAENGLIGAAGFLFFAFQVLARGLISLRAREPLAYAIGLGVLASLVGFLVQGLTQTQIKVNVIAAMFFVLCGIVTALADRTVGDTAPARDLERNPVPRDPWAASRRMAA